MTVMLKLLHAPMCRFGCGPAAFIVEFSDKGCVCFPDKIQALCPQHWQTAEPIGGDARVIAEFANSTEGIPK
jgi:hypothetical protein